MICQSICFYADALIAYFEFNIFN